MSEGDRIEDPPETEADPAVPTTEDPAHTDVRAALLAWYDDAHRPFPWRATTDPYEILVCEVMSQQTQLERIEEPWRAFLDRWPTPEALADADRSAVVSFWTDKSLGYNNRARYLHEAAAIIAEEWGGEWPTDPASLQALPGVGPYTANAIASFAFNEGDAVVDTNVRRVLHRLVDTDEDDPPYKALANRLLPEGQSRRWNNAIMELGSLVCRPTPRCDAEPCPLRASCAAYATGDFTAPDVPEQPSFEGSRRQFRGRIVRALSTHGPQPLAELGPRVSVDYGAESEHDSTWLLELLEDLEDDGLAAVSVGPERTIARLRR